MTQRRPGLLDERRAAVLRGAAAASTLIFLAGLWWNPSRTWANLLMADFFFLSWALAGTVFLAVHSLASAGWPVVFKRVPEAMTAYLPAGAALLAALCLGLRALYPWADPTVAAMDPLVRSKALLLNTPVFILVTIACLSAWIFLSRGLVRQSRLQDQDGALSRTTAAKRLSAAFLVVFGITFTLASIEWLMSLEPRWYSTIYPWYLFGGLFVQGLGAMTALVILLRRRGVLQEVNPHHLHDLGKYLFAFSVFWAYLWFSQFLLVWYSNIPEEAAYFVSRTHGNWKYLFWLNPVVNFVIPFFLLLKAHSKKSERRLLIAAAVLAVGQWLDLYVLIFPSILPSGPKIGWMELAVLAGVGSVFLLRFDQAFRSAPAAPTRDPFLAESAHFHG